MIETINKKLSSLAYKSLDKIYRSLDRSYVRRTKNIKKIPSERYREGGKYAYSEWAHVIGIFQAIIGDCLESSEPRIVDIGCGTGLVAISVEPYIEGGGYYVGMDVDKERIDFCKSKYRKSRYSFKHLDIANTEYHPDAQKKRTKWPVESSSYDMCTALSVWTHLARKDAIFYFNEVERVLKKNGKFISTFFLLDESYQPSRKKEETESAFHNTRPDRWIFENKAYGEDDWWYPSWAENPERAAGVTKQGIEEMVKNTNMEVVEHKTGNWKETNGLYFQDILIFEKKNSNLHIYLDFQRITISND